MTKIQIVLSTFRPHARHEQEVEAMLEQVVSWAKALETVRFASANLV